MSAALRRYELNEINVNNYAQKEKDGVIKILLSELMFVDGCEEAYDGFRSLLENANYETQELAAKFYETNDSKIAGYYQAKKEAEAEKIAAAQKRKNKKTSLLPVEIYELCED